MLVWCRDFITRLINAYALRRLCSIATRRRALRLPPNHFIILYIWSIISNVSRFVSAVAKPFNGVNPDVREWQFSSMPAESFSWDVLFGRKSKMEKIKRFSNEGFWIWGTLVTDAVMASFQRLLRTCFPSVLVHTSRICRTWISAYSKLQWIMKAHNMSKTLLDPNTTGDISTCWGLKNKTWALGLPYLGIAVNNKNC